MGKAYVAIFEQGDDGGWGAYVPEPEPGSFTESISIA